MSLPEEVDFDPNKNPAAISLIKESDGNWKGRMQKFGKLVEIRQADPQIVLQLLLTHDGK